MIEMPNFPKEERKELPPKLTEDLEGRVRLTLSDGIKKTPIDIEGYPDLAIFSLDDMKRNNLPYEFYSEITWDGYIYFVARKIQEES
jgi:hypothetical protein